MSNLLDTHRALGVSQTLSNLFVAISESAIEYHCDDADYNTALRAVLDAHTVLGADCGTWSLATASAHLEHVEEERCDGVTTDYSADTAATDYARSMFRTAARIEARETDSMWDPEVLRNQARVLVLDM
jgi:hypothetical protein